MSIETTPERREDSRLAALLDAAEQELTTPNILHVISGSWLIQGKPASTKQFIEATHDSLYNSFAGTKDARRFRGSREELDRLIREETGPIVGSLGTADAGDGRALNLLGVTIIAASGGSSLHPPAVRVPVDSITAWWITDFVVNDVGGGGGAAVGFDVSF